MQKRESTAGIRGQAAQSVTQGLRMFCAEKSIKNRVWAVRSSIPISKVPSDIHPVAAEIAASRGVGDLDAFFSPSFAHAMPDPSVLQDMDAANKRVGEAIVSGERIGIIGDYDVDGATSTAIMVRMLTLFGHSNFVWRIPHRIDDGYGPNVDMVQQMIEVDRVSLIIMLDCGTSSHDPVAKARALGCDAVIVDHHPPNGELPVALVVNPKRLDEDGSLGYLCTAGLAFLFGVGLRRWLKRTGHFSDGDGPDMRPLLSLVTLGTIADVVPLIDLNRAYVVHGLKHLPGSAAVRALAHVTDRSAYSTSDCGFYFIPCINAAGRIEDMRPGVELLLTDDDEAALSLAKRLFELNTERKIMQNEAVEAAKERVSGMGKLPACIVIADEDWHPGIVGLVAGRLKEAFDRPAIAIGAGGKGSARSVEGFDIGAAIREAVNDGQLVGGGGHAMAAGVTIERSNLTAFAQRMEALAADIAQPGLPVDKVLTCGDVRPALVRGFNSMAPFGQGNTKPRVAVVGGKVTRVRNMRGLHVAATLDSPDGTTEILAFNSVDTLIGSALQNAMGCYIDVYGTLDTSTYLGVESAHIKPEDLMIFDPAREVAA